MTWYVNLDAVYVNPNRGARTRACHVETLLDAWWSRRTCLGASLGFLAATLSAQTLNGVVDIHAHSDPDSVPRSIDAIDAAKLAHSRGLRGLVLKNHYEPTASLAYLVRKVVPGIELFGGIALNRTVGGVNPAAVERMTRVKGGWGRVVWMPTFDAENQVRFSKENRPSYRCQRTAAFCRK